MGREIRGASARVSTLRGSVSNASYCPILQEGRILLGLKLSIYSSLVFYKKMATLEIEIDEI